MRTILVLFFALALTAAPSRASAQIGDTDLAAVVSDSVRGYVHFSIFDDVNVSVTGRSVTLTGRVTMPFKRDDIGARIAKIDGVRAVVNEIGVLPVSQTDQKLRVTLARVIYGHPSFWQYASMANPPIHIVVERGRVTLTGRVNSDVERMLAYSLAQVDGALSVSNQLKLDR